MYLQRGAVRPLEGTFLEVFIYSWLCLPSAVLTNNASSSTDKPIDSVINTCKILQVMILFIPVIVFICLGIYYFWYRFSNRVYNSVTINSSDMNQVLLDNNNNEDNNNINNSLIISDSYSNLKNS